MILDPAYRRWKTQPLDQRPLLSVVIPAYNEAERIVPTIGAVIAHLSSLDIPWELIVVDDGSTDDTATRVEELALPNLHILQAPQNSGKGAAVRRGMLAAVGSYILFTDADNSTPIEELPNLLSTLITGEHQVAIGSRAATGASASHRQLLRQVVSGGLRLLVRHLLNLKVRDTQCGFKLYTREAARALHGRQTISGFSFDLELIYLAGKLGYSIAEVPVQWIEAPGSKVDPIKEIRRFLRDLIIIKTNDWRGIYEQTA